MNRYLLLLILSAAVSGCSTLPRDGPSNRAITRAAQAGEEKTFALVDLTYEQSERIRLSEPAFMGSLIGASSEAATDLIQVGDTIEVSIFEPGGALFGGGPSAGGASGTAVAGLPALVVNRDGAVAIPYAGQVRVVNLTPQQAEQSIRRALIGKIVSPQVVVSTTASPLNGVTVIGAVKTAGRVPLATGASSILDVVAAAGGVSGPPENVTVTVTRNGQSSSAPLSVIYREPQENVRLARGDLVNLVNKPRRFSSFGALGAVTLTEMPEGDVTLTGALSSLGGLSNATANARAVLVFRFERPDIARSIGVDMPATRKGVPMVYRLNLAEPQGFFVANNFLIQAEDVIYVPRADSAEIGKFFELVQTFTRVIYDISVTSTLSN